MRRSMTLIAALITCLLLSGSLVGLSQAETSDISIFRGNPARTGAMPGPGPAETNGIVERWRVNTGHPIYSSAAIVDGVVYIGSGDGNIYALEADTGTARWRVAIGNGVFSSPALADGVLYIGNGDGNVYALDATSGAERWRFRTGNEVNSSPAVVDGVVYVGSHDGNVYALDAAYGTERWRFTTGSKSDRQ